MNTLGAILFVAAATGLTLKLVLTLAEQVVCRLFYMDPANSRGFSSLMKNDRDQVRGALTERGKEFHDRVTPWQRRLDVLSLVSIPSLIFISLIR